MSCDFGIWKQTEQISTERAGAIYVELCDGRLDSVSKAPAIYVRQLLDELCTKHGLFLYDPQHERIVTP